MEKVTFIYARFLNKFIKSKLLLLTGFAVLCLFFCSGCKKSDNITASYNLNNLKIYNDTLAEIRNSSINIASGNGMVYMTYGIGNSNAMDFVNGILYFPKGSYAKLMALNDKGSIIWQKSMPVDIVIDDLLTMNDGSCVAVGFKTNLLSKKEYLYVIHLNKDGGLNFADSILMPVSGGVTEIQSVNVMRSINGNLLFFGSFYNSQSSIGFLCEYTISLKPLWVRTYSDLINACVITSDGDYLVAGSNLSDVISLQKINAAGNKVWAKSFNTNTATQCNDLVALSDGKYALCFSDVEPTNLSLIRIYEVNGAGDSLNSKSIYLSGKKYINAILALPDGGIIALMNSISTPVFGATSSWIQHNSNFIILNKKLEYNLNGFSQTQTNEIFTSGCTTSDGKLAFAGLIQPFGKYYYKPVYLILNH